MPATTHVARARVLRPSGERRFFWPFTLASVGLGALAVFLGPGGYSVAVSSVTIPLAVVGLALGLFGIFRERGLLSLVAYLSAVLNFIAMGLAIAGPPWWTL